MKVFVYFNLRKKLFSVKALQGPNKGRVISHADKVFIDGAQLKVSQAGRERVLRERRKNVHAGVVGTLAREDNVREYGVAITYNPYKHNSFVKCEDELAVSSANHVKLEIHNTPKGRSGRINAVHAW